MVREVITIDSEQSAKNAARLMAKFGISGLVVLREEELVGILTERDILTRVVASGQNPENISVKEIMTEPIIVVNPMMPLDKAVRIMFQEKIKKLPVVTKVEENLRLVGILSLTDIARLHPKLLEDIRTLAQMNDPTLEPEVDFYIR
ncbi:MAG: CBS domain-containing protein [Candidatus Bathyarchaeota archaeon]|nr:CBS domain-containing protein [Candidatus Bathyarchaeota archaeon]